MSRSTVALCCFVGIAAGACGGRGDGGEERAEEAVVCEAREAGVLAHDFDVSGLAGDYAVTLVATAGDSAGKSVEGHLRLLPHADSLLQLTVGGGGGATGMTVGTPLYGAGEINLSAVNALQMGDLGSLNPMKPGAVTLVRHVDAGVELTIRLGSLANQRGIVRFDGGYSVLRVHWAEGNRFGGSWASGLLGAQAEGFFCAVKT